MSQWPSTKADRALAALFRIGWYLKRPGRGSHRILAREGWPDYVFAFHDGDEPVGTNLVRRLDFRNDLPLARRCSARPLDEIAP